MKTQPINIAVTLCAFVSAASGESAFERDLKQLIDQRDKAIAAAAAPINTRFNTAAEQLLRRATQSGDLDSANKIKAAMGGGGTLGGSATSTASPASTLAPD